MRPLAPPRRRWRPATVLGAVLAIALLVAVVLVAVRRTGRLRLPAGSCGDRPVIEVARAVQVCTFDDEFDGTRLDPAKWQVETTARYGFHSGSECFVDDGRHVRVGGGMLSLTTTRDPPAGACRTLALPYRSGMVTTSGRFAQTYGRFSIRARLPGVPGSQPALWLYPQRLTYGRWPASGEIDIAEAFGSSAQTWPHLHYAGADGRPAHPGGACPVKPGFHTYTVDWTPASITFHYDAATCLTINGWAPAPPLTFPEPFDKPYFVLLELATGLGANSPDAATPLPVSLRVDYVRVWNYLTSRA